MKRVLNDGYIQFHYDEDDDEVIIDMIEVKTKRRGTGTALIQFAKDYASKKGKDLTLCAYPQEEGLELEDLVNFYEKNGFTTEWSDDSEALMRY